MEIDVVSKDGDRVSIVLRNANYSGKFVQFSILKADSQSLTKVLYHQKPLQTL